MAILCESGSAEAGRMRSGMARRSAEQIMLRRAIVQQHHETRHPHLTERMAAGLENAIVLLGSAVRLPLAWVRRLELA